MDVFVTGATGVLGRATVPLLVDAGHRVRGLARSESNRAVLERLGAEAVRADLFDRASLQSALQGSDAILHLATKIPSMMQIGKRSAWRENDRIRREGTHNLVEAAIRAGIGTLLYQSVTFVYPESADRWVDARTAPVSGAVLKSTLEAEAEVYRFIEEGGRGLILRMGGFYGLDSILTRAQIDMARSGLSPFPGSRGGYVSVIWIPDAAAAVVAALREAPAGVYDVVDDRPLTRGETDEVLKRALHRRRMWSVPTVLFRLWASAVAPYLTRSQRVSNRRLKDVTGWEPRIKSGEEGWARLAATRASLVDATSLQRATSRSDVASGQR